MDRFAMGDFIWASLLGLASLAPLGTFAAVTVAVFAIWQKSRTDKRQAWWERLRWATDTLLTDDPQSRETGSSALKAVSGFKLRTAEDRMLLKSIAVHLVDDEISDLEILDAQPLTEPAVDGNQGLGDNSGKKGSGDHGTE